ncbi:Tetratricopeptide repeat-containing protein [Janthinobacterium sp. 344]|uniref:ATP-binding protein n=2 Tax=unclassified Janthinobacterium TaxID=2610881 RepID=UPI00088823BA|nr:ATP-binding protein [Janthinobacterium sp. 344]SDA85201.1 Tetratricopeptide repeat-containing protein [Janthinobacterium sp. 551a]SFB65701.1 Tetratricopeptide repeat-containing protein [Janthinobacterium sp. 344]
MEMFALEHEIAQWENALQPLRGAERIPLLLLLSWHLRQRDCARAIRLGDETRLLLPLADLGSVAREQACARLQLVQAEVAWLQGALDAAEALALQARATLCAHGDGAGCADAHWLLSSIAVDRGDHARCDAELQAASEQARSAGDSMRASLADAATARWAVLRDAPAALARWGTQFMDDSAKRPAPLAAWVHDFRGLLAHTSRDLGTAAGHYMQSYEAALESGQLRGAITAAINIGDCFGSLNDHESALEWMQCALDLARPTGWPRSIGAGQTHTAETMRKLGRLGAAEELLREALHILAPVSGARTYANALFHLGELSLDKGDYDTALDAFSRLAQRAEALGQADFRSMAQRGSAHALSYLDRPDEAHQAAQRARQLAAAQGDAMHQVAALRVLAMLHARHELPPPAGMQERNPALHFLHQALQVAASIDGYVPPGELLDALAREYAHAGDYARAYDIALDAGVAREKSHTQQATNRAIAMQVHHQTEHARSEGYHHRELAASEARRAEVLQQTSDTLERLSAIGQEITTHLDASAVFQVLDRHVHALLPVNTFAVYMLDPAGTALRRAHGMEAGRPLPDNAIPLSNPRAYSVRCLLGRREVYIAQVPPRRHAYTVPGTLHNQSVLYVPLMVGERVLGVMTVQACQANAYGERERLIFRTLCAYGAIALDNASAYRQLQDAQAQLVSQEKLAALGSLMAGVAHELNTPIGNSLLIASTMQQKTEDVERLMNGPGLRRSDLASYIEDAGKASALVMRGLHSAADLVNSFKQVAVDRTTEQRRQFDLQQVSNEIIATVMNRIRSSGHRIEIEIDFGIAMDSYPGPFGQVITNLINNALLHAFDQHNDGSASTGRMRLSATVEGARVQIVFEDNGGGIAEQHLSRIFDPFFTTKLGQGGSGLGLSISYNIVTALLGGGIQVASSPAGTRFTLDLPLVAPRIDAATPANIY